MKEIFKMITKNLRNLGIEGCITFTGSAVLKTVNLLDREVTDIDIILVDTDNNKKIIKSLKNLFGTQRTKEGYSETHTTLPFGYDNKLHLDIFFGMDDVECFNTSEDYFVATPKHIIKKKLSYGREKDIKDWQEIQLNALDELVFNICKI